MKLTLEKQRSGETEITILYSVMDQRLQRLVDEIRMIEYPLQCRLDGAIFTVPAHAVFYMESIDGNTFVYTESKEYESTLSLNALEDNLSSAGFVRISKSCVLNLHYLKCVTPLWNARLEACMKNGERLIITRHYAETLKEKLGI